MPTDQEAKLFPYATVEQWAFVKRIVKGFFIINSITQRKYEIAAKGQNCSFKRAHKLKTNLKAGTCISHQGTCMFHGTDL